MVRYCYIVLLLLILSGCAASNDATKARVKFCADLNFENEQKTQSNPVSILEKGVYFFDDDAPVSKACVLSRTCQVNDFVRQKFGQSYYVSLTTSGDILITELFPETVSEIREGRGSEQRIYLNNFCTSV